MDCSPPGSSVQGIFQARILEWSASSSTPGNLPDPGIKPKSPGPPTLAAGFFTPDHLGKGDIPVGLHGHIVPVRLGMVAELDLCINVEIQFVA